MSNELKSRIVFIDTQVFERHHFKFENPSLSRLHELAQEGEIKILISDVVDREVEQHLSDRLSEIHRCNNKLLRCVSILESQAPEGAVELLESLKEFDYKNAANARWSKYKEDAQIEVLSCKDIDVQEVMNRYFNQRYPFQEGKKKSEFPDAVSILSLKKWQEPNQEIVYVIGKDGDFEGYCAEDQTLISIDDIKVYLDICNTTLETIKNPTAYVHQLFDTDIDHVVQNVASAFLDCEFTYENNWEADVYEKKINDFQLCDMNVIAVNDEYAVISATANVNFTANIIGPDYDNSMWDSEDKEYIILETFDSELEFIEPYEISMTVYFEDKAGGFTEIESISFDGGSIIELPEYDEFPYK
ncbi:MAG: PIN domain-containing protein [Candidatus Sedimenticola sp. (ex Thyasira tokunagai)]